MKENWHGLIKIHEVHVSDKDGKILWENKDLYNILHYTGEQFILNSMFIDQSFFSTGSTYYFGLDTRNGLNSADTMSTLQGNEIPMALSMIVEGHPLTFATTGYARRSASSSGTFSLTSTNNVYSAMSPIISFTAINTGPGYSPVNLFLTTTQTGYTPPAVLIASVSLNNNVAINVPAGGNISMRMSLTLAAC